MADSFDWDGSPAAHGWYAVVLRFGELFAPGARHWAGAWNDDSSIVAHHGPHHDAGSALDWAEDRCPED